MLQLSAFRGVASDGRKLRLADLPIVEKIYILNSAVVVIFTCGVVSAFHWQLILEYEGVKESSRWTEKQEKTVDVGTNTDGGGSRVWWKFSGQMLKNKENHLMQVITLVEGLRVYLFT